MYNLKLRFDGMPGIKVDQRMLEKRTIVLLALILGVLFSPAVCRAQPTMVSHFDTPACSFSGSKTEQARLLLRKVEPMGRVDTALCDLPNTLSLLLSDSVPLISPFRIRVHLDSLDLGNDEIGGDLRDSIASNGKGVQAKYFVIHDVSTPNYKKEDFPTNINDSTWSYNEVRKNWNVDRAHVFVGRTGESFSPVNFSIPWRATKFELKTLDESVSKGLFLHIELVQPRRSDTTKWKGNDIIAPEPGFTTEEYDRLALLYVVASVRARTWLVPTFHAVLDEGIKGAHDDPQNFDLATFDSSLANLLDSLGAIQLDSISEGLDTFNLMPDLWATYYYIPTYRHTENGIDLLDNNEKETGLKLDLCSWCDACIQGTVFVEKDSQKHVFNFSKRSETIQTDCRGCSRYTNYRGYEATGKVLWQRSEGFGFGVCGYQLEPFKTIAVDSMVLPYGTVVFIPEAVGTPYTDADGNDTIHDGYFFCGDTGSLIKGNHIDVFIGNNTINPFDFVQSNRTGTFRVYRVADEAINDEMQSIHR